MKKKYSTGGQILGTLAGFVPGFGGVLSPLILGIDKMRDQKLQEEKESQLLQQQMEKGGFINDNFKQYNTGSHKSGYDLSINNLGLPDINGQNSVQNQENLVPIKGKPYVMSDTLTNPETGNTFNKDASKLQKKYKGSRFYQDQKASLDLGLERLAVLNDKVRTIDSNKMSGGGPIVPPPTGTIFDLGLTIDNNVDYIDSVPPSDNLWATQNNISNINLQPKVSPLQPLSVLSSAVKGFDTITYPSTVSNKSLLDFKQSDTSNPDKTKQPFSVNQIDGANAVALGLKGLALGRSVYDALQPAEKESLIKPNYTDSDRYLRESTIDYTQAKQDSIGASNILAGLNRSSSSSYQQMLGRESARIGQLQDQLGRISEAETNANSQLNMSKSQYEQQKAVDTANRLYQNRIDNQMNQANQRGFTRDLFGDLSRIGTEFNKYGETQRTIQNQKEIQNYNNNQMLTYLNSKYPNLKVDPSIIQKFQTGVLTVDDFLSYLPTNVQTDLKNGNK